MITKSGKMSCYDFGRGLLKTNDLDPLYVALWEAEMPPSKLRRWLLAFWCFYHSGTASWIADLGAGYWERFRKAAASKDYPRCHERRHFRGAAALKCVDYLEERGVEKLFQPLTDLGNRTETDVAIVMKLVQQWYLFGPWISFKVADMLERLSIVKVAFDDGAAFLFDSPRKAAEELWDQEGKEVWGISEPPTDGVGHWAVGRILDELGPISAPPRYERPINSQEAETILCKWKSYMGGHYHLGEDVTGLRSGLLRFARCRTSQELIRSGRKGGLWSN